MSYGIGAGGIDKGIADRQLLDTRCHPHAVATHQQGHRRTADVRFIDGDHPRSTGRSVLIGSVNKPDGKVGVIEGETVDRNGLPAEVYATAAGSQTPHPAGYLNRGNHVEGIHTAVFKGQPVDSDAAFQQGPHANVHGGMAHIDEGIGGRRRKRIGAFDDDTVERQAQGKRQRHAAGSNLHTALLLGIGRQPV